MTKIPNIVERLRGEFDNETCQHSGDSAAYIRCQRGDCACQSLAIKDAADEIERLRTRIETLSARLTYHFGNANIGDSPEEAAEWSSHEPSND